MSALKTFRIKQKLAKKMKQNRPIPQWIRWDHTRYLCLLVDGSISHSVFSVLCSAHWPEVTTLYSLCYLLLLLGWGPATPSGTTPRGDTGGAPSSDCKHGWRTEERGSLWSLLRLAYLNSISTLNKYSSIAACTEFIGYLDIKLHTHV